MSSRFLDFLGISAWRRRRQEKKLVHDLGKYVDFAKVDALVAKQEAEQEAGVATAPKKEPIQPPVPTRGNGM